jgi:protein-S-isoprenylcysteine O-methyltransferase Ste14
MGDQGGLMTPEGALYAVWIGWIVSWELAALWSSRARARLDLGAQAIYRVITGAGFVLVLATPPFPAYVDPWRRLLEGRPSATPLWATPDALGWPLVAIAAAGLAFAWWARLHLGALWSSAITRKDDHRIVDTGPYGLVRHPIYTGILAMGWALALDKATPAALAGAVALTVGYWLKGSMEEGFLSAELGAAAYDAYRRRTPMLVPFLPRQA